MQKCGSMKAGLEWVEPCSRDEKMQECGLVKAGLEWVEPCSSDENEKMDV